MEAKDIGAPLAPIEKSDQLKRYRKGLPNLILTDYLEFRWYVDGERRTVARLGSADSKRGVVLEKGGLEAVEELLHAFLEHKAQPISKPKELAERLARLTHLIRDIIVQAFQNKTASPTLRGWHEAFAEVLIPDLSDEAFADMFSQTIAYGLFAARVNHSGAGRFRRQDAAALIPKTNPFLRKLFGAITGPDLDDEPFVGFVDDLAQLLADTDMARSWPTSASAPARKTRSCTSTRPSWPPTTRKLREEPRRLLHAGAGRLLHRPLGGPPAADALRLPERAGRHRHGRPTSASDEDGQGADGDSPRGADPRPGLRHRHLPLRGRRPHPRAVHASRATRACGRATCASTCCRGSSASSC